MDDDVGLLGRYVQGRCSAAERLQVERWAVASPANRAQLDQYLQIWQRAETTITDDVPGRFDSTNATARVHALLGLESSSVAPAWHSRARTWGLAGATIALLVFAGIWTSAWSPSAVTRREYATAAGQRLSVALPDGSRMLLAPASHAVVNEARHARTVTLDGEAYFSVVHDPRHPFVVHAGSATVTDIGTMFDVSHYPEDHAVRVAVKAGEVAIAATNTRTNTPISASPVLHAGDIAEIVDAQVSVMHDGNLALITAWQQGGLSFQRTPLDEVVVQLARTFDIQITIADSSLRTQRITASFDNGSVDDVLGALTQVMGARYTRHGRKVVIQRQSSIADPKRRDVPALPAMRTAMGAHEE